MTGHFLFSTTRIAKQKQCQTPTELTISLVSDAANLISLSPRILPTSKFGATSCELCLSETSTILAIHVRHYHDNGKRMLEGKT